MHSHIHEYEHEHDKNMYIVIWWISYFCRTSVGPCIYIKFQKNIKIDKMFCSKFLGDGISQFERCRF